MAKTGFPSMTALLGLLAVAGYQNRDKLAELFGGQGGQSGQGGQDSFRTGAPGGLGGLLGGLGGGGLGSMGSGTGGGMGGGFGGLLGGLAGGAGVGGLLSNGIGELMERFRGAGHGDTAESWVRSGPNQPIEPHQLEQAIGPETLEDLTQRTGLSRSELLERLSRELPAAVDQYTPEGRY